MNTWTRALFFSAACSLVLFLTRISSDAAEQGRGPVSYYIGSTIEVTGDGKEYVDVKWPIGKQTNAQLRIGLREREPLIRSISVQSGRKAPVVIATGLDPVMTVTIGERDPQKAAEAFRGMVFFENPRQRPYTTHALEWIDREVHVTGGDSRITVSVGRVAAGSFRGDYRFTFYANSPLIRSEAVVSTREELRAILYDAGLSSVKPDWKRMVWVDALGTVQSAPVSEAGARSLAVKYRGLAAEGEHGSVAVFAAPHQYFYPLDFADNFKFTWAGNRYGKMPEGFGFGIRQPLEGDRRWVPWFDAPAHREHRLSLFYLVSAGDGAQALEQVAQYTRGDRFREIPGFKTFTSHYHVEHTLEFLKRQKEQNTQGVPRGLESPGFVRKFKETGIDIVHLAEFHHGWTPGQKTPDRLRMLKVMHEECARLSDSELLVLPGEEPNVHLGGHWMSFFPKPVYWVLNRAEGEPFEETVEGFGKVYHVGSTDDVLRLMKQENGLMWTAHARIKASARHPDAYRERDFYQSDHFLGAAWKAMPADLSRPTLGWRVLDLLDDMNQWGERKQVLGEVDVFEVHPDYELYGHMNINYVKLKKLPRFGDGWQPVLDVLRGGRFFTTTGEVLIPEFSIGGRESGEVLSGRRLAKAELRADLEWTFPLSFAEVVMGDGRSIRRQRIELNETEAFGRQTVRLPLDLRNQKWVRFEVWDIAANGAFTQPVWVE